MVRVAFRRTRGARARISDQPEQQADEVITLGENIADLPTPCRDLLERAGSDCYEFGPDWLSNLQEGVYFGDEGVRYLALTSGDRGLAFLPIRFIKRGRVRSIESLANYYSSLFSPALWDGAASGELTRLIGNATRAQGGSDEARFAPMDPNAPTFNALSSALMSNGWIPFRFFCFGNWHLKCPGSWDAYLSSRSANFRSAIKRAKNKFLAAGGHLEIIADTVDLSRGISAFESVYSKSWKVPEPYPKFIPGLMETLAASGKLRLGVAWVDQQPVAAQLWFVNGSSASIFKLAYDERCSAYSPGTVLTAFLMQHVMDVDKVAEVDFLIGDDQHKRLWMSHRRERWGIVAYNPRTMAGITLLIREIAGRVLKSLYSLAKRNAPQRAD